MTCAARYSANGRSATLRRARVFGLTESASRRDSDSGDLQIRLASNDASSYSDAIMASSRPVARRCDRVTRRSRARVLPMSLSRRFITRHSAEMTIEVHHPEGVLVGERGCSGEWSFGSFASGRDQLWIAQELEVHRVA